MHTSSKTLIELENKFWQSLVNQDTDTALDLLTEPALMVSSHGAIKFDHAGYRKMAEQGSMVVTSFELSDMEVVFPHRKHGDTHLPRQTRRQAPGAKQGHGAGNERHLD